MTYLLDTNTSIEILNDRDSTVTRRLATAAPTQVAICSVVKAELYHGAYKSSQRESNLALLARFFSLFESLPFDDLAAETYGRVRAQLERQGQRIGPYDLMIAAISLANGLILVTHNTREFSRVPDLQLEDWQAAA